MAPRRQATPFGAPIGRGHQIPRSGRTIAAGFVFAFLLSAFGITWFWTDANRTPTDPNTLCRTDAPPAEVMAILIDVSDYLSDTQRLGVVNALDRVRADLPRFGLLELYMLPNEPRDMAKPVASICNPGDGSDMNRLYENPVIAKRHWKEDFRDVLDTRIAEMMLSNDSKSSPLMEAIQAISLQSFGRIERAHVPHRLVVVSDLIQHVPAYSQYSGSLDFEALSRTPYYSTVRTNLAATKVEIVYIARPTATAVQSAAHVTFWNQYFSSQGARIARVDKIHGA